MASQESQEQNASPLQNGRLEDEIDELPRAFTRRLILLVNLVFLVTMVVFLAVSFGSERSQHHLEAFAHLEETLGVISLMPEVSPRAPSSVIGKLESRLSEHTGVPHRLLISANGEISAASKEELLGLDLSSAVDLMPISGQGHSWGIARMDEADWLVASIPTEDIELSLFRLRRASEEFAGKFFALHGVHIVVTVVAFVGLLMILTNRYVRRPIEQLARHARRVEQGEFKTSPHVSGNDEFAWLARRFSEMGEKLQTTVQRLVRSEKYSSVTAVTLRVARDLRAPLERMERHIVELESVAQQQPDLIRLGNQMRKDRESVIAAIRHLSEIEPPEED